MFKRWMLFVVGVAVMALGVCLATKAQLGTTAISALPYVASLGLPPTIGMFSILMTFALVGIQLLIVGRAFPKYQYLQIPIGFLFGFAIDFWMYIFRNLKPESYLGQFSVLVISVFVLATGVFMIIRGNIIALAGEAAVLTISKRLGKEFGTVKTFFDCTMVLLAVILSLILFHRIEGIREGTVFSAVFAGVVVKYMNRIANRLIR